VPDMSSMDSTVPQSATAETTQAPSEVDVPKRDAANGSPAAEEPPSKKARIDEPEKSEDERDSRRNRGIAPIKAE
jgi:hypothetical protein